MAPGQTLRPLKDLRETKVHSLERRVLQGDEQALAELLRHHDHAMRAVAWKALGSADRVDDALQDAYLKAYRGIGKFRGDSAFLTWLHRIVANTCIDHLRTFKRRNETSIDDRNDVVVPAAEERYSDSERIREALLALPDEQRMAVLLIDCEGYSYEEAATMLGLSTSAIGSRLFRARRTLNELGDRL